MKTNWRIELPHWLLIGGMFLAAGIMWSATPDRIPVHWNLSGQVDRYGGKVEGLLLVPAIALGIYLLLLFIPRLDPGRANYTQFAGAYAIVRMSVTVLMVGVHVMVLCVARGIPVAFNVLVPLLTGGLFLVLGSVMGRIQPNWFVGIRTPWTLSSRTAWTKTHRLGGRVFMGAGLVIFATALLRPSWMFPVILVAAFGGALVVVIYSFFAWRAAPDKVLPTGTLPAQNR